MQTAIPDVEGQSVLSEALAGAGAFVSELGDVLCPNAKMQQKSQTANLITSPSL